MHLCVLLSFRCVQKPIHEDLHPLLLCPQYIRNRIRLVTHSGITNRAHFNYTCFWSFYLHLSSQEFFHFAVGSQWEKFLCLQASSVISLDISNKKLCYTSRVMKTVLSGIVN